MTIDAPKMHRSICKHHKHGSAKKNVLMQHRPRGAACVALKRPNGGCSGQGKTTAGYSQSISFSLPATFLSVLMKHLFEFRFAVAIDCLLLWKPAAANPPQRSIIQSLNGARAEPAPFRQDQLTGSLYVHMLMHIHRFIYISMSKSTYKVAGRVSGVRK